MNSKQEEYIPEKIRERATANKEERRELQLFPISCPDETSLPVPMSVPQPMDFSQAEQSMLLIPSFLESQIGKVMRVEFLLGKDMAERVGRLVAVGAGYILLKSIKPGSTIMCDISSIKFATIIDEEILEL